MLSRTVTRASRAVFGRSYSTAAPKVNLAESNVTLRGTDAGVNKVSDLFKGKKAVVVSVVGAFTSVCTANHVPAYNDLQSEFKKKGVDEIYVVTVNDHAVLKAWGEAMKVDPAKVKLLGDWDASFATLVGQDLDLSVAGFGKRSHRYAMLVEDGKITKFVREEKPSDLKVSDAKSFLSQL